MKWLILKWFTVGVGALLVGLFIFYYFIPVQSTTPIEIRGGRGGQTIGADGEDSDAYNIVNGKIVMTKKGGGGKGGKGGSITINGKTIQGEEGKNNKGGLGAVGGMFSSNNL